MKFFFKHALESFPPRGQRYIDCSEMHFQLFNSILSSQKLSAHDAYGQEEEGDRSDVPKTG